ncbi:hypothetical protein A4X13_0g9452 [Tilletia indica]|uniref:Uncharacterized protein n=1 Tax=Tilletia indica TaxID=43049 RepID=A0A177SZJ8_9BASI|nr:hypothetical protein A4X13_0g9452 [Tilletia indica]
MSTLKTHSSSSGGSAKCGTTDVTRISEAMRALIQETERGFLCGILAGYCGTVPANHFTDHDGPQDA